MSLARRYLSMPDRLPLHQPQRAGSCWSQALPLHMAAPGHQTFSSSLLPHQGCVPSPTAWSCLGATPIVRELANHPVWMDWYPQASMSSAVWDTGFRARRVQCRKKRRQFCWVTEHPLYIAQCMDFFKENIKLQSQPASHSRMGQGCSLEMGKLRHKEGTRSWTGSMPCWFPAMPQCTRPLQDCRIPAAGTVGG